MFCPIRCLLLLRFRHQTKRNFSVGFFVVVVFPFLFSVLPCFKNRNNEARVVFEPSLLSQTVSQKYSSIAQLREESGISFLFCDAKNKLPSSSWPPHRTKRLHTLRLYIYIHLAVILYVYVYVYSKVYPIETKKYIQDGRTQLFNISSTTTKQKSITRKTTNKKRLPDFKWTSINKTFIPTSLNLNKSSNAAIRLKKPKRKFYRAT